MYNEMKWNILLMMVIIKGKLNVEKIGLAVAVLQQQRACEPQQSRDAHALLW